MRTVINDKASKMVALYEQGYSCKDICDVCNASPLSVRTCLRQAGFDTRTYRKVSDTNRDKIVLLVEAGYSYARIESLLHLSTHLIREVVFQAGLIGFAPKNHPPIELQVKESEISFSQINQLYDLYISGKYGLTKCADKLQITDKELLWFVFHLKKDAKHEHLHNLIKNIRSMTKAQLPVTAIAKKMDISPSLVKKYLR